MRAPALLAFATATASVVRGRCRGRCPFTTGTRRGAPAVCRARMASHDPAAAAAAALGTGPPEAKDGVEGKANVNAEPEVAVQYVVVRRDLAWPAGSVAAQAVHACVAAVWRARDLPATAAYCDPMQGGPQMHTVVLETSGDDALLRLADALTRAQIDYVLWREQPENIVTALAARPYPRSVVQPLFRKFKLFK